MKPTLRSSLVLLLLAMPLFVVAAAPLHAQDEAPAATSAAPEKSQTDDTAEESNDRFRHAAPVKAIARNLHLGTETAAKGFEDLNSGILILVILFFLLKTIPKALRSRTATIQKQLVDARSATEVANERLAAVEAKLARLGDDIDAIRQQTERDIVEDEKRIKQSLEDERQRIVKAAGQEIESAAAAAQRELKRFAANLSIDQAAKRIQLTVESDKALVEHFGKEIVGQFSKGGRH